MDDGKNLMNKLLESKQIERNEVSIFKRQLGNLNKEIGRLSALLNNSENQIQQITKQYNEEQMNYNNEIQLKKKLEIMSAQNKELIEAQHEYQIDINGLKSALSDSQAQTLEFSKKVIKCFINNQTIRKCSQEGWINNLSFKARFRKLAFTKQRIS